MKIKIGQNRVINRINPQITFSLIFSYLLLVIAMHATLYIWVSAITVLFMLWRFMFQQKRTSLPTPTVLNSLAIGCSALIYYFSIEGGVLNGMTNLLLLATSLKILSLNRPTDVKNVCLTLYFAIASAFIFQQGIGFSILVFSIFTINSYTLLMVHTPDLRLKHRVKFGGRFLFTCVPLTLFLFVLMPRLGPLWQMPTAKGESTGLSESINPGDFTNLAQSSKLAFRASFDTPVPENQRLYWRAMVHERFDGKKWTVHRLRKTPQNVSVVTRARSNFSNQQRHDYQVIIEPSYQSWLYVLDTPIKHSEDLFYHFDRRLSVQKPVAQQFQYSVSSVNKHQNQQHIYNLERHVNLMLPKNTNPQTRAFANKLRRETKSDREYINKVLSYFVDQKFIYTLQPPLMPVNPVDQFLFNAKAGFCSHYASAFAVMMRAAGIPARIVSGYQGGERSDNEEYVSVYQYDAHAWNEVWLEDRGWVRYDPTAIVSPQRIAQGLQAAMQREQSFLSDQMFSLVKYNQVAIINWLRNQMNNMDFLWSSWVLNFNSKKQSNLFESLWGKQSTATYGFYFAMIFIAFLAFIYLLSRPRVNQQPQATIVKLHKRLLKMAKLYQFERPDSLPPLTFLQQFADEQPQLKPQLMQLHQDYQRCLYQKISEAESQQLIKQMKKTIKQLSAQAPDQVLRFKLSVKARLV